MKSIQPDPTRITIMPRFLLLGALLFCGRIAPGEESSQIPGPRFPAEPTDAEIFNARVLDEPLVPLNDRPLAEENKALASALTVYAHRATPDDCSGLAE